MGLIVLRTTTCSSTVRVTVNVRSGHDGRVFSVTDESAGTDLRLSWASSEMDILLGVGGDVWGSNCHNGRDTALTTSKINHCYGVTTS